MLKNINFAKSLLVGNILTGGVALEVTENEGDLFPSTGTFRCVIWGAAYNSPLLDTTREIITMTLTSGDIFAITRAREGTDAKGWSTNDHIGLVLTAGKLNELEDYVQSGLLSYGVATGTNIYVVTLDPALSAYASGVAIHVKFVDTNTGTPTLNVNGLGAKKIYNVGVADYEILVSGDIFDGMHAAVTYETSLDSGGGGWILSKIPAVGVTAAANIDANALVVGDDGAKGVKKSVASISDAGILSGVNQIAFPSTAVPSADPNTIDDYEEGTAEMAFVAGTGTITIDTAYDLLAYTKVGRVIHIQGELRVSTISNPSGGFTITGLPFTVTSLTELEQYAAVLINYYDVDALTLGLDGKIVSGTTITVADRLTTGVENVADHIKATTRLTIGGSYIAE